MKQFPIFLNLENRPVLVVGDDGPVVAKIRLLAAAGARITVVAAEPVPEIVAWAKDGSLRLHCRNFTASDLHGQTLVIANRQQAEAVVPAARAAGVLVNVIDGPAQSDFSVPAIIDREPVTVAIASNGLAPALARNVRQYLDAALPERLQDVASLAANFRDTVARFITSATARRRFWNEVFDGPIAEAVLAGKKAEANHLLIAKLNSGGVNQIAAPSVVEVFVDPDDLESLTRRDLRHLRQAEAILHEAGLPERALAFARREARRIEVPDLESQPRAFIDIARDNGIESGSIVALRRDRNSMTPAVPQAANAKVG